MRTRRRRLLLVLGVTACASPDLPDPAPVVWVGQHVELASSDDAVGECGGTREHIDEFVGAIAGELQLELGGARVRQYVLDREALEEVCDPHERCTLDSRVYTEHEIDAHELVHATRNAALGEKPGISLFEEGLAMMYGSPEPLAVYLDVDPERDVYAGLEALPDSRGVLPSQHYGVAGDFTRFLEVTYGMDEVAAFIDGQDEVGSVEALEVAFEQELGEPLSSVVERYQAEYPQCSHYARTRHVVECARDPMLPDDDGVIRVDLDLSCDNPDVVGPVDDRVWTSFTFEVETFDMWRLEAPPPSAPGEVPPCYDFRMEVVDCDRGCLTSTDLAEPAEDSVISTIREIDVFEPGRYVVRLSRAADDPGRACLEVGPFVP